MRRAYKYKIRMNRAFLKSCADTLDCCRDLYNAALSQRINYFKQGKRIGFLEQAKQLTEARELPHIGSIQRSFQQNALRRLDLAFQAFFRRAQAKSGKAGFPRFRGYERYGSFNTMNAKQFRLSGDKLTVQKLGSCRIRLSRPLGGRAKTLTIRRECDGWYVIIGCDNIEPSLLPTIGRDTGIDVGLESFATLSDGSTVTNPRYFRKGEAMLARAQQRLSSKKRGSQSRNRSRLLVAKAHAKIRRQRDWFHWQQARKLVADFDRIVIERLDIKALAQGRLAKSIHDAGWASFIAKLASKAEEAGRELVKVSARFTSQDCSGCGRRARKELSERWHSCRCGLTISRDHNAALNILARAGPAPDGLILARTI